MMSAALGYSPIALILLVTIALALHARKIGSTLEKVIALLFYLGLCLQLLTSSSSSISANWLSSSESLSILGTSLSQLLYLGSSIMLALAFILLIAFSLTNLVKNKEDNLQKYQELVGAHQDIQQENIKKNNKIIDLSYELKKINSEYLKQEENASNRISTYQNILDNSPILYIELSDNFQINDVNDHACKKLQYSFAELINFNILDLVPQEQQDKLAKQLTSLKHADDAHTTFDATFVNRKGQQIAIVAEPHIISKHDVDTLYLFCDDVSESRKLSNELVFQATHDELTELHNRRALTNYFEQARSGQLANDTVALVYIDMDQFKVVNDTCGHATGDKLLKQVVSIMKVICEDEGVEVLARIGGDEFAIVLVDKDTQALRDFTEKLRNAIEDFTFVWENKSFRQSISVGVAQSSIHRVDLQELLSAADAACYSAKESGRNQVKISVIDDDQQKEPLDHRHSMLWVSRIEHAMKHGRFSLTFQPIVKLDKPQEQYLHYEVLLQYRDENGQILPPGSFLPSAERFGKSNDIDLWVITETLDFLSNHPLHTAQLSCCAINLTSHSIQSERSRSAIISLAQQPDFPASKICFEITETSAISNLAEAVEFIKTLKDLGCRFALDDFGTGFSSFGYLKNLDVDYIKIDGSFVRDIVDDKIDKAMINAISSVAREMGIETVAEYVETEEILQELIKANVNLGQGYGIAKPLPLASINQYYQTQISNLEDKVTQNLKHKG